MSFVAVAVGVGTVAVGAIQANQQKKAAQGAANAQVDAGDRAIAEQRRQFDKMQQVLSPYTQAGNKSLAGMMDILGVNGKQKASDAIIDIEGSPEFQSMTRLGEEAILANASATGGLRGGNTQGALAQFRPQILNQLLQQKFQRLQGVTQLGQASAAGVGSAALQTGANVGNIMNNQGEAVGQGILAKGNANSQLAGTVGSAFGSFMGSKF